MASNDQLKEPIGEDYTASFDSEALDIPLEDRPLMSIETDDQVVDFPYQNPNEINTPYPEHMLNGHIVSETYMDLEGFPWIDQFDSPSPAHHSNYTHIGNTPDYEGYHAKFFGMDSEPESEDPVPEPVQEFGDVSQYPEAFMDPRLLMYEPAFWVYQEQGNQDGPNVRAMSQPRTLTENVQALEPLLAQQPWVSYIAPTRRTQSAPRMEPASDMGLSSFPELTFNAQLAPSMNPASCPELVSYSASGSYVGPAPYPESPSPPEPMPSTESVFQPQPQAQPLGGDSLYPFRLHSGSTTTPTPSPPGAGGEKRKYGSYYFEKIPATEYGETVGEFISQHQSRSKTPCDESVIGNPDYNQPQMTLSSQEEERPSKRAKVSSLQGMDAGDL
ncbi:hypothetical protein F4814DRAFT_444557 [Daldinia grandis]|nr:hypothetical protein F4814DRAFT_444557 [Daldinia grandis]